MDHMSPTADPLDVTLRIAHDHGEVLLYTPPTHVRDGHHGAYPHKLELVPNPLPVGAPKEE